MNPALQKPGEWRELMSEENQNIDWTYHGKPDFLLGTGATKAEQALGWTASLFGAGLFGYFYWMDTFHWAGWQYLVAGLLAFDVIGGVVANSLNSCKRFYHSSARADEPAYTPLVKNHLAFTAFHVHTILVALLYERTNLLYGFFWYALLVAFTVAILKTPLYLRRPLAFLFIALAILLNLYFVTPVAGFEWLVPALYIKILYGHLVREEPYRP
jgi:hypothetical protein